MNAAPALDLAGQTVARPLRVIFAGTPAFAAVALERMHAQGHTVALVLTQPDRPAGRGLQLQASAVKQYALAHGFTVAQPRSLRLDGKYPDDAYAARQAIQAANADVMVVAAYGLILPQWVLDDMAAPHWGCLNIHGSVLPRWRGAAPIHRAIEAGDAETGVCIMQMDAGQDTGDILLEARLPISADDTTGSLHDAVAECGADLLVQALAALPSGLLQARRQPEQGVTYAHKITRQEAAIDWRQDANAIARRVRAFDPFPGAYGVMKGENIKVWRAQALPAGHDTAALPGTIVSVGAEGIAVAAAPGRVLLQQLQRAGGKRLAVADFLRGFALEVGMRFDLPTDAPTGSV